MAQLIPQDFIDDLLSRVDLVEVVRSRVTLKRMGTNLVGLCPFHNEKTPSFTVSANKQFFYCFGCGATGSAIKFVMNFEHLDFVPAVEQLAQLVNLPLPETNQPDQHSGQREQLLNAMELACQYYQQQLSQNPQAIDYLKKRGLTREICKHFRIGFAPEGWHELQQALSKAEVTQQQLIDTGLLTNNDNKSHYDRFRHRIMFPIRNNRGKIVAFGGRVINDDMPKYLNSPESTLFHKRNEIYGLFEAKQANRQLQQLLIVEGYMDVVALAQYDISYAVATLGTAITHNHIQILYRNCSHLVFCFDGDQAGRNAAWKALELLLPLLEDGRQAHFLFLPQSEDPDSMVRKHGKAHFESLITQGQTASDYLFESLKARIDTSSLGGRAEFANEAKPLLNKIPEGVFKNLMLQKLAQITGLNAQTTTSLPLPPTLIAQDKNNKRTPIRTAITYIIQYPKLALTIANWQQLATLDLPGTETLATLVEKIIKHPQISTASLIEQWESPQVRKHLAHLATEQLAVTDEAALAEELRGTLNKLEQNQRDNQIKSLLAKANGEGLTRDEKFLLQELIKQNKAS